MYPCSPTQFPQCSGSIALNPSISFTPCTTPPCCCRGGAPRCGCNVTCTSYFSVSHGYNALSGAPLLTGFSVLSSGIPLPGLPSYMEQPTANSGRLIVLSAYTL